MFKKDWTAKPNAAVWREWVKGKWETSIKEKSDTNGLVNSRGHLGKYEISVNYGGKTVKMDYQLTKESAIAVVKF